MCWRPGKLSPACQDAQLNHTTLLLTRTPSARFATDVGEFGSLTFSGSIDTSGDFLMKGYVASSETASLSDTIVDALAEVGSDNFGTWPGTVWCPYKNKWSSSCRYVPTSAAKNFITGSGFALDNLETQFAASLQARAAPRSHKLDTMTSELILHVAVPLTVLRRAQFPGPSRLTTPGAANPPPSPSRCAPTLATQRRWPTAWSRA